MHQAGECALTSICGRATILPSVQVQIVMLSAEAWKGMSDCGVASMHLSNGHIRKPWLQKVCKECEKQTRL